MNALQMFALLAILFLVIFVASNARRAGWFGLVSALIGVILIALIAINGPVISTFTDHLLHFQSSKDIPLTLHTAVTATSQTATSAIPHLVIPHAAGNKSIILTAKLTSVHQSVTTPVTAQNTLAPILFALLIGLVLGSAVLVLFFLAIRRFNANQRHGITTLPLPTRQPISPLYSQPEPVLNSYQWRPQSPTRQ